MTKKILKEEIFKYHCENCQQVVNPDMNALCSNCGETIFVDEITEDILSINSKYYLIFLNTTNGKYVTKVDLNRPNSSIKAGAKVCQVTKEFFDMLTPEIHDTTPKNGYCGSVIISKVSSLLQLALSIAEENANILAERIGAPAKTSNTQKTSSPNQEIAKQSTLDTSLGEEIANDQYEGLSPNWKARTKPFIENDLFINFD